MNDLKDALNRVADASAPDPIALETVRGRARQIRRRRTATAVVGAAAAVAVIAGAGVAFLPSNGGHDSVPPATQTPSVTATQTPSQESEANAVGPVHPVVLDPVQAAQTFGDTPRVPVWHDGVIEDVDGTATRLPERPFTFAKDTERGGWVVIRAGEAHAELVRVSVDGTVTDGPYPTFSDALGVGADGQLAYMTQENGQWWLWSSGRRIALGRSIEWATIDGVDPSGRVVFQADDRIVVADVFTGQVTDLPAAAAVQSAAVPITALGGDDGTWTARRDDGATAWSLDWAGVSSFSPDGRYVALSGDRQHRLPGTADWDSEATSALWIRTAADLLPVAAFVAPEGGYFWSWTWEGDSLLATVYLKGEWSLVRLSADGYSIGRATGKPGSGEEPAYVFAAQ